MRVRERERVCMRDEGRISETVRAREGRERERERER